MHRPSCSCEAKIKHLEETINQLKEQNEQLQLEKDKLQIEKGKVRLEKEILRKEARIRERKLQSEINQSKAPLPKPVTPHTETRSHRPSAIVTIGNFFSKDQKVVGPGPTQKVESPSKNLTVSLPSAALSPIPIYPIRKQDESKARTKTLEKAFKTGKVRKRKGKQGERKAKYGTQTIPPEKFIETIKEKGIVRAPIFLRHTCRLRWHTNDKILMHCRVASDTAAETLIDSGKRLGLYK